MTISELISLLSELMKEHGDLPVLQNQDLEGNDDPIVNVNYFEGDCLELGGARVVIW